MNRIANTIRALLSETNDQAVVGVLQMPSADWICSLVAINHIGAIYLPLDLRVGVPRLRSNVQAGRPVVILVDTETVGKIEEVDVDGHAAVINVSRSKDLSILVQAISNHLYRITTCKLFYFCLDSKLGLG